MLGDINNCHYHRRTTEIRQRPSNLIISPTNIGKNRPNAAIRFAGIFYSTFQQCIIAVLSETRTHTQST